MKKSLKCLTGQENNKPLHLLLLFLFMSLFDLEAQDNNMKDKTLIIPFHTEYIQRNDTIFHINIYSSSKGKMDSVKYSGFSIQLTKSKWITDKNFDGSFSIVKYQKVRPSVWFCNNNGHLFFADFSCKEKGTRITYYQNGDIYKVCRFLGMGNSKKIKPKIDRNGNTKPVNIIYHRIQKGETLSSIANKYYTTEKRIKELNDFKDDIFPTKGRVRVQ